MHLQAEKVRGGGGDIIYVGNSDTKTNLLVNTSESAIFLSF